MLVVDSWESRILSAGIAFQRQLKALDPRHILHTNKVIDKGNGGINHIISSSDIFFLGSFRFSIIPTFNSTPPLLAFLGIPGVQGSVSGRRERLNIKPQINLRLPY